MAQYNDNGLDTRRVPCARCGAGFDAKFDGAEFLGQCVRLGRGHRRRGGDPIELSHTQRATLAKQWASAGRPSLVYVIAVLRLIDLLK